MVASDEGSYESLKYCLEGTRKNLIEWGHEYLRALAGEIGQEYNKRVEQGDSVDDLMFLVDIIIPYFMKNHEEPEAVDLLMEVEALERILNFTNDSNFERVCNYLLSCSYYAADAEEMINAFKTAFRTYMKHKKYPQALRVAQKINSIDLIKEVMETCTDQVTKKQMAFMLGRQRNPFETQDEELYRIISNEKLSEHFKGLARDLDVLEPKNPEQIFKTHLEERKNTVTQHIDSAKQNLATTYVNAFVNAAYGKDLLMTSQGAGDKDSWIYKNKEGGMLAAAASLGMTLLWDIDEGLSQIDKYMEAGDDHIVAGSYIAIGIVNSGIKNETDPVFAILLEKLESPK
jgi:26S proteasome regulatory subunit N1